MHEPGSLTLVSVWHTYHKNDSLLNMQFKQDFLTCLFFVWTEHSQFFGTRIIAWIAALVNMPASYEAFALNGRLLSKTYFASFLSCIWSNHASNKLQRVTSLTWWLLKVKLSYGSKLLDILMYLENWNDLFDNNMRQVATEQFGESCYLNMQPSNLNIMLRSLQYCPFLPCNLIASFSSVKDWRYQNDENSVAFAHIALCVKMLPCNCILAADSPENLWKLVCHCTLWHVRVPQLFDHFTFLFLVSQ